MKQKRASQKELRQKFDNLITLKSFWEAQSNRPERKAEAEKMLLKVDEEMRMVGAQIK